MVVSAYAGKRPMGIVSAREFDTSCRADALLAYLYDGPEETGHPSRP
jgi:hypothetical protein